MIRIGVILKPMSPLVTIVQRIVMQTSVIGAQQCGLLFGCLESSMFIDRKNFTKHQTSSP